VHDTICYGPAGRPWPSGSPKVNQIVFIGRNLHRQARSVLAATPCWVV
jgi:hypothetical protein